MLALVAACATASVLAAPADDYERGVKAYQRGDVVDAMAALRPAAQAGHVAAQTLLAFILDRADFPEESVALYRSAAGLGDAEGHSGLANAYLTGRGVTKDEKLALQHFSKAADLGHGPSIELIASAWAQGRLGLKADDDLAAARAALLRAAEQGHLASAELLGQAHAQGRLGLSVNAVEAARWQARVAELRKQRSTRPAPRVGSAGSPTAGTSAATTAATSAGTTAASR